MVRARVPRAARYPRPPGRRSRAKAGKVPGTSGTVRRHLCFPASFDRKMIELIEDNRGYTYGDIFRCIVHEAMAAGIPIFTQLRVNQAMAAAAAAKGGK